jgi:hypothetical protein
MHLLPRLHVGHERALPELQRRVGGAAEARERWRELMT